MKRTAVFIFATAVPFGVSAGCIGPVIMGECKGQIVQWDTHPQGASTIPPAPPGFYHDKRGTNAEQMNPGSVNPFTGRDAHDADMDAAKRSRCHQRRDEMMHQGILVNCQ